MKKITTVEELAAAFKADVARRRAGLSLDEAEQAALRQVQHEIQTNVVDPEVGKAFLAKLRIGPGSRTTTTDYGV